MMRWRSKTLRFYLCCVFVIAAVPAVAMEDSGDLVARIDRATAQASLVAIQQKPWHLKLDVAAFDDKGKNPQHGTIEYWQSGKSSRTTYEFGSSSSASIQTSGNTYFRSSGPDTPDIASEALSQILEPGVNPDEFKGSIPELRKQKFGKVSLDCIMLTLPEKSHEIPPLGLFPTYCMDPGKDNLRLSYNFGSETVLRNGIGTFLGQQVTTVLALVQGDVTVATAKVVELTSYLPQPDEFQPAADMRISNEEHVEGGVIAGKILTKTQPVYPDSAKERHLGGKIVLRAIIGRDGHIHSLRPVSSDDPDLAISAIDAVRHWTYQPYLLNGEPTEVDTTITVNYNLNY